MKISLGHAVLGASLIVLAVGCCTYLWLSGRDARFANPVDPLDKIGDSSYSSEFPEVDWAAWQSVNPDIVGWISVPGTEISYPVVAASSANPTWYLTHDVYGNFNLFGSIYLDAACEDNLFAQNAVISGHHMRDGSMFAALANFADEDWACDHQTVLVQTPSARRVYEVEFVRVVNAKNEPKRCNFASSEDFSNWYGSQRAHADVMLDRLSQPDQVMSLVTCSYGRWANERTVVYCSQMDPAPH